MEKKLNYRTAEHMLSTEFAKGTSLPKTKFKVVRDTGKTKNAVKFFQFWEKIPPEKRDLAIVKVYRLWPICDVKAVDPKATLEVETMRGEIPFPSDEYETAFLYKFGSGEWKVLLSEDGVTGAVMIAFFSAIDMENHPPKLDYRTLLHGNFKNQDYIKWLERQPNVKLPWTSAVSEAEEQEQEEEMTVASQLTEVITSQNAHVISVFVEWMLPSSLSNDAQ